MRYTVVLEREEDGGYVASMKKLYLYKHVFRRILLAFVSCSMAVGCSSYQYKYVLEVRCVGRKLPNDSSPGSYVGLSPPVRVSIICDGRTEKEEFNPMGETKTLHFSEGHRLMIDGNASVWGFKVFVQRPGYKDWSADYSTNNVDAQCLMETEGAGEGGSYIRLDSVLLEPIESTQPSRRVMGGPTRDNSGG